MFRATLLYISLFIATLALILLALSAFGTGTMSFPSADRQRAGFAGFQSGTAYFAWQSFLDGPTDATHMADITNWGKVTIRTQRGESVSGGMPSIDLESRFVGIGWTSEPIVQRLGMYEPSTQPLSDSGRLFSGTFRARYYGLKIPLIWIALLSFIYPAIIVRHRLLISRRLAHGRCVQCGYDLRESPERCPECGVSSRNHVITAVPHAAASSERFGAGS
ncbi:MAG: hypothetical protein H7Z14_07065 [Anaerolineae bacterium]|nr:hypothetical protein [Phycisphaerae bacterium]